MHRLQRSNFLLHFCLLLAAALAACTPTFNWREVRPEGTALSLLLPCKPDKAERAVPLGGRSTQLALLGCDAGGATFAVAVVDIGDAARAAEVLAQWQALTLANMQADAPTQATIKVPGALQPPVLVTASGKRADGAAFSGSAAYFAQGAQLFQVVMYAAKPAPEAFDTFFSSLRLE